MLRRAFLVLVLLAAAASGSQALTITRATDYEADVSFALEAIGTQCSELIRAKSIDWKAVEREMSAEAQSVRTDTDHMVLLVRLLARLNDGHAVVRPTAKTKDLAWPDDAPGGGPRTGCGMFWCRIGSKIHVKSVWNAARAAGVEPGMEVVRVDGVPAAKWLSAKLDELRDYRSYSTEQHALFDALHGGLAARPGARMELELRDPTTKKAKKRTVTYSKAALGPWGPAVFPPDLETTKDVTYGMLASGFAYVHVRRSPGDLPEQIDAALAVVAKAPGLVLDYRGNSGGGFDHEALLGRFVPAGRPLVGGVTYASAGPRQFVGPIVVIVDGTVKSAGETGAGIFKEDGRAYMIGESPTAGMASQKTTIALPSGLFELYVSTGSNKSRFNGGRGIEGVGVIPHEIVAFDAQDLAQGRDTLIVRAEELLRAFPEAKVPYRAP